MISNLLILQQLYHWNDGDYITIYDIDDVGRYTVIARITGPDARGPQSHFTSGHWQKKIISCTSNKMLVEFRSLDYVWELPGFSASIHYLILPSKECKNGLDMTRKTIKSPNQPDLYDNNLVCKWLISVRHGSHITLKFLQFEV